MSLSSLNLLLLAIPNILEQKVESDWSGSTLIHRVHKLLRLHGQLSFIQLAFVLISIHCSELFLIYMSGESFLSKLVTKLSFNYCVFFCLVCFLFPWTTQSIELRETESSFTYQVDSKTDCLSSNPLFYAKSQKNWKLETLSLRHWQNL